MPMRRPFTPERAANQATARAKYPFCVGHVGSTDLPRICGLVKNLTHFRLRLGGMMAKQSKLPPEGAGKIKFRVIEFEIDGSDTSLQESLKSLTAALTRGSSTALLPRTRLAAPAAEDVSDAGQEQGDQAEEVVEEDLEAPVRAPLRRPTPPRKPVQVKFLTDLRTDTVQPPLAKFAVLKAPENEIAKYLVIAYWFKNYLKQDDLSLDHFFTAYKHIGWTVPKDPQGPVRDARHKRRVWLTNGKTPGTVTLTYTGERAVDTLGTGE